MVYKAAALISKTVKMVYNAVERNGMRVKKLYKTVSSINRPVKWILKLSLESCRKSI